MSAVDSRTLVQLRNILWTTDFSSSSETALRYATSIARRYDSQIYVAHVIRPDVYHMVPPESLAETVEQTRLYAERQLGDLLISGRLHGIRHQVLLEEGELWPTLCQLIEKHSIDLIVAGTHGRTGVRKLLLGSVAEEIFRMAWCPVLTVGPKASAEVPVESELRHILFASDFTPASERAAAHALSLAQEHQAHLTLLHVVEESLGAAANTSLLRDFFLRRLRALVPEDVELWCEPEFAVEWGTPAGVILNLAAERQADLIVLGVRRSGNFPGHLPPATAYKVVCTARCPVLTIRG